MEILAMHDPWPAFKGLRDDAPIVWDEVSQSWLVSRYEHLRPLLRGDQLSFEYAQEQVGVYFGDAPSMVAMEGKQHARRRRLVNPFFHGAGLERFNTTVERRAHAFLDPIWERERAAVAQGHRACGRFDFVAEFSLMYPVDVIADAMALPVRDYTKFREWYSAFLLCLANFTMDQTVIDNGLRAKREFGDYILPLIAERRGTNDDDLISRLCRAEIDGERMTDEDIRTFLSLMLLAGGETTDHQLALLMHTLAQRPDVLQALRKDRGLMDAVLAEGMRYCAIVRAIQRDARSDIEFDGVTIPAGARITLMLASGNRDERRFERAGEFIVDRTDNALSRAFTGNADHLGFGAGSHVCMGSHLALREMSTALNLLLDNATDIRVAEGYEPRYEGLPIRSLPSLELTFTPV
jgi:cytochrome P450